MYEYMDRLVARAAAEALFPSDGDKNLIEVGPDDPRSLEEIKWATEVNGTPRMLSGHEGDGAVAETVNIVPIEEQE